ncbi:MAG: FAD-dependent oxidoreductase [Bacteroidia bacterium]
MDYGEGKKAKKTGIIVGGGLAGGLLGLELLERGWRVLLWDDGAPEGASRVAAGLFNVITGRFGAKSWQADLFLDRLKNWLEKPGHEAFRDYIRYTPIYRPFKSVKEYNKWQGRALQPEFSQLVRIQEKPYRPDVLSNELGGIWIKPCGWVDVAALTESLRKAIDQHPEGKVYRHPFQYSSINPVAKCYHGSGEALHADHYFLRRLSHTLQNLFFSDIPCHSKIKAKSHSCPSLRLDVASAGKYTSYPTATTPTPLAPPMPTILNIITLPKTAKTTFWKTLPQYPVSTSKSSNTKPAFALPAPIAGPSSARIPGSTGCMSPPALHQRHAAGTVLQVMADYPRFGRGNGASGGSEPGTL